MRAIWAPPGMPVASDCGYRPHAGIFSAFSSVRSKRFRASSASLPPPFIRTAFPGFLTLQVEVRDADIFIEGVGGDDDLDDSARLAPNGKE